jgi:hypothetical protein
MACQSFGLCLILISDEDLLRQGPRRSAGVEDLERKSFCADLEIVNPTPTVLAAMERSVAGGNVAGVLRQLDWAISAAGAREREAWLIDLAPERNPKPSDDQVKH